MLIFISLNYVAPFKVENTLIITVKARKFKNLQTCRRFHLGNVKVDIFSFKKWTSIAYIDFSKENKVDRVRDYFDVFCRVDLSVKPNFPFCIKDPHIVFCNIILKGHVVDSGMTSL